MIHEEPLYLADMFKGATKATSATSFVRKLYTLVACESDDIVCFVPDGSAFEVKDPKKLEAEILPKYFRHSRFQSFVRQLNFYNFKKTNKERSMWIYKHELFHRDRPDFLDKLKRKTSTGEARRFQRSASSESTDSPRNCFVDDSSGSSSMVSLSMSGHKSYEDVFNFSSTRNQPQYHPMNQSAQSFCGQYSSQDMPCDPSSSPNQASQWRMSPGAGLYMQGVSSSDNNNHRNLTDDEADDSDETDGSSGSSWDALACRQDDPPLGLLGEIDMTNEFFEQLANTMLHSCPSLSQAGLCTILFCVQWAALALNDQDLVKSKVLQFLFDTPAVNQELRAYRAALDPSIVYDKFPAHNRPSSSVDVATLRVRKLQGCFDKSRVLRDFMAFSLMCINGLRDRWDLEKETHAHKYGSFRRIIEDSHKVWKRVASKLA